MPEVSEVGVVPVLDRERGEEVMAIIVLNDEAHLTAEQVQEWCRKALTAFKIPRYVEFRDTLPHTPSGKIAKAVLRAEADQFGAAVVDLRPPVPAARP
jgi:acyl-coenzyme A synthetase/AMP-(fatty) acid ligase